MCVKHGGRPECVRSRMMSTLSPEEEAEAKASLQEVIYSAQRNGGMADTTAVKQAMEKGYSLHYIANEVKEAGYHMPTIK